MELHKELIAGNLGAGNWPQYGMLALHMTGPVPSDGEELKAAIDIYDIQDIYAKCLGVQMIYLAKGVAEGGSVMLTDIPSRVAWKKGDFDFGVGTVANNLIPADMRKASLPDKVHLCNASAPFARITDKLGMGGVTVFRTVPWVFYDGGTQVCFAGPTTHAEAQATSVIEYEWLTERNFGGLLRGYTNKVSASNGYTLSVEAWNDVSKAWDEVLAPIAKAGGLTTSNYVAFTSKVRTKRLRVKCVYTGSWGTINGCFPHGVIPLEVIADAPALSLIPDITWTVLIPFNGGNFTAVSNTVISNINDVSYPVPMLVGRTGLAGSPDVEIILSKVSGLMTNEKPTFVANKFISSNLIGE